MEGRKGGNELAVHLTTTTTANYARVSLRGRLRGRRPAPQQLHFDFALISNDLRNIFHNTHRQTTKNTW